MRDILLGVGAYLVVGAVFFGVICSTIDKSDVNWEPPMLTIFVSSLIWPLSLIAAIAYAVCQWLNKWKN